MPPIEISTEGTVKLLKDLKPQKAPGPDSITPRVLKECADSVAPILQQIFQKSLKHRGATQRLAQGKCISYFQKREPIWSSKLQASVFNLHSL